MKKDEKNAMYGGIAFLVVLLLGVWWLSASVQTGVFDSDTASSTAATSQAKTATAPAKSSSSAAPASTKASGIVTVTSDVASGATFAGLLSSTGVATELKGKGPYTIFVPTDSAFSRLPMGMVSNMSAAQKRRLVEYHVIVGRAIDVNAVSSGIVTAFSNDPLNFTVSADKSVTVGSAKIVDSYKASNGMVYTVSDVLLPPLKDPAFQIK